MTTLTLGPALEGLYDVAKGYDYTARLDAYKAKFQDILAFADTVGGQLTPGTELTVRTIVPTAPTLTSAPTQPIVITGQAGTAGGTGLKQEAVVIDASNLPSGTVIQLQDIEFAAIVGAVRVTGGSGQRHAVRQPGDGPAVRRAGHGYPVRRP